MGPTLAVGLIAAAGIGLAGYALSQTMRLQQRVEQALKTTSGDNLETSLVQYHTHVSQVDQRLAELEKKHADLLVTTSVASQKISVVRFNPFGDTGGDQSFSLAVLDGHDSGYVLTSIHGRQGTRVYLKPIDFGKSKHSLSDEESLAISQAIHRVPTLPSEKE